MSIICCVTTERNMEDNDDLLSVYPRFRLKRGYTRSDMTSTGYEQSSRARGPTYRAGSRAPSRNDAAPRQPSAQKPAQRDQPMVNVEFDQDYGREDFEYDNERNRPEQSPANPKFLGVAPQLTDSSQEGNVGGRIDRGPKGYSIAGSVSALRSSGK